ncbi:PACE efflux transporter [Pontibaca salina]|uniref:PACE efflux transporter n=1 Tax=Pontibaca salina TaxID=2795731 RepID=A0A934LZ75_9RHOB|nr:PACE efflux transporter [Pontibaca salina]
MRTTLDRIRHAILFEVIGLILFTLAGTWVFSTPMSNMGVIAIFGATLAMLWNYLYNLAFDHVLLRFRGQLDKTVAMRALHAILFEIGLMILMLPFIMWYLGIGLVDALIMDMGYALFFMCYAFVFNWGYDIVFPIPALRNKDQSGIKAQ